MHQSSSSSSASPAAGDCCTAGGCGNPFSLPPCRWSQRDAIISLVRKAGFTRPRIPREVWDTMRVTRYRSTKAALSYHEWQSGATV